MVNNLDKNEDVKAEIAKVEAEMNGEGRILVRPSGTEPLVRVMVEASTDDNANRYAEQIAQVVEAKMGLEK